MRLHALALLLGVMVDLGLSTIIGPIEFYFLGIGADSPYLYHASLILGLLAVAMGAYVTAHVANADKIFNVGIYGVVQVLLSIGLTFIVPAPLWFGIAAIALVLPASLLGGYIHARVDIGPGKH